MFAAVFLVLSYELATGIQNGLSVSYLSKVFFRGLNYGRAIVLKQTTNDYRRGMYMLFTYSFV